MAQNSVTQNQQEQDCEEVNLNLLAVDDGAHLNFQKGTEECLSVFLTIEDCMSLAEHLNKIVDMATMSAKKLN